MTSNWTVEKIIGKYWLFHLCGKDKYNSVRVGTGIKDSVGWYCSYCEKSPPSEVALFAELCYCEDLGNKPLGYAIDMVSILEEIFIKDKLNK